MDIDDTQVAGGDRCAECGAKLTEDELQLALENGGPWLCKIHAVEIAPMAGEDPADPLF
ncbi:MAG TPA: hypothetical protein VF533_10915 [Solirubrobacteraceae bacterium]|jgi:hypothetical protein